MTRTNCPGFSTPSAFGSSARISNVPVGGIDARVREIDPAAARDVVPSASLTVTSNALSFGSVSRPSLTARLSASCSFSEIANGTQIGLVCEIVVSSVSFAVTRLPSDFGARLDSPAIGATTRV